MWPLIFLARLRRIVSRIDPDPIAINAPVGAISLEWSWAFRPDVGRQGGAANCLNAPNPLRAVDRGSAQ